MDTARCNLVSDSIHLVQASNIYWNGFQIYISSSIPSMDANWRLNINWSWLLSLANHTSHSYYWQKDSGLVCPSQVKIHNFFHPTKLLLNNMKCNLLSEDWRNHARLQSNIKWSTMKTNNDLSITLIIWTLMPCILLTHYSLAAFNGRYLECQM